MAFLTSRKDQQYTLATEISSNTGIPYLWNSGEGRDHQKAVGHKELLSDVVELGNGGMALGSDAFMFAESGTKSSRTTDLQIKSLDPASNLNSPAYFPDRRNWAYNNPWDTRDPSQDRIGQDIDYANGLFVVGAPNAENGTSAPKGNIHVYDALGNVLFSKQCDQSGIRTDQETLYGQSVAIGCGIIAVGAPYETDTNYPMKTGSVYLYDYSGNFITKLKSTITDIDSHSDLVGTSGVPFECFGYSVAIGCDRIVVGAPGISYTHSGSYANTNLCPLNSHSTKTNCDNDSTSNHHDGGSIGNWHQHWHYLQSEANINRGVIGPAVYIYDLDGNLIKRIHATTESGAPDLAIGNVSTNQWIEDNNQRSPEFGCSVDVAQGRIIVGARNYMGTSEIYNESGSWETRALPTHDAIGKAYLYDLNGSLIKEIFCPEITPEGKGLYDLPGPRFAGTWASGGNLITARILLAGAGTQTAGLCMGGTTGGQYGDSAVTEEYNGTSWSSGGNLGTARSGLAGAGTQSAGLCMGGTNSAVTEEYNGTSWSYGGNLITARYSLAGAGAGTQTAGLCFGGHLSSSEEYDGTSWSYGGNLITARQSLAGAGTQTAGLCMGGTVMGYSVHTTEEYDGTSWSSGGNLAVNIEYLAGTGTQTTALCMGGADNLGKSSRTEEYDGTSWSGGGNILTARKMLAAAGTKSVGLNMGGTNWSSAQTVTEEYTEGGHEGPDVIWKRTAQYWSDIGGYYHSGGTASRIISDLERSFVGGIYGFQFGRDVSIGSGRIVIGAPGMLARQEINAAYRDFAGAAYTFDLDGNFIEKLSYNTATDNLKQGNNNSGSVNGTFPGFGNFGYRVLARKGYIFISQPNAEVTKNSVTYKGIIHVYKTKDIVTAYDVKEWSYGY